MNNLDKAIFSLHLVPYVFILKVLDEPFEFDQQEEVLSAVSAVYTMWTFNLMAFIIISLRGVHLDAAQMNNFLAAIDWVLDQAHGMLLKLAHCRMGSSANTALKAES